MKSWQILLLAAVLIAVIVAPFASAWPDGLERVASTLGFEHHALPAPLVPAPLPDYSLPGLANARVSTAAAGVLGLLLVFGALYGWGKLLARRG